MTKALKNEPKHQNITRRAVFTGFKFEHLQESVAHFGSTKNVCNCSHLMSIYRRSLHCQRSVTVSGKTFPLAFLTQEWDKLPLKRKSVPAE